MLKLIEAIATGLVHGNFPARRKIAWAVLALLSGGVTLARAVNDPKVGAQIANSVTTAVVALAEEG